MNPIPGWLWATWSIQTLNWLLKKKQQRAFVLFLAVPLSAATIACNIATPCQSAGTTANWSLGSADLHNTRFQCAEVVIDSSNVSRLVPKWQQVVGGDVSATPSTDGTRVYFPDWGGYMNALSAETGEVLWQQPVSSYLGIPLSSSRTSPAIVDNGAALIIGASTEGGPPASLIKIDAATGSLIWASPVDAHPAAAITANPVAVGEMVITGVSSSEEANGEDPNYPCCTFRGSVVALNEITGEVLWKTYMVPENGGAVGGYSGGAVWGSTPLVDTDRGLVYVGTGNNYTVPASVAACQLLLPESPTCADPNNRIDAVVALDLATGAIRWTFRAQYSDNSTNGCLFGINCESPRGADNDFAQAPLFIDTSVGSIVFAGQKSGIGYALDADTGMLKWSTRLGFGIQWGSATDGQRIYVASRLNVSRTAGTWSALDPASGKILWTTNDPGSLKDHAFPLAPVSVANGVLYGGSENINGATMFGLDTTSGRILFSYNSGSSVAGGASVLNGAVYWGSGYSRFPPLTGNRKMFAFALPGR